jgi:putative aminopeptidase FrvX
MKKTAFVLTLAVALLGSCSSPQTGIDSQDGWYFLQELLPIQGVSGHEAKVADYIQESLPSGIDVQRDDMENVWFTVGKGKPHLLFVAHTDELGYTVQSITPAGTLKVRGHGGFFPLMYEGHSVVVYTASGTVEGVVSPRQGYLQRNAASQPFTNEDIEIDLGVSAEEDARQLGVTEGDPVTIRKEITSLSPDLISARAIDDRAGCAAVLAAALRIDWGKIEGKTVTFAWDVQEETGLFGAARLAEKLEVDYVFPVDTFVSSAGPFDPRHYAHIPLGEGAVIRAIDSSNIAPQTEVKKVLEIARRNGIPVHIGNTSGGNDGSVFLTKGTVDIPLSWPGVYSHSFIEKIHRYDLTALTDLIVALVKDW